MQRKHVCVPCRAVFAEDLFFSICSPIERSVVFQLRKSCGSRAVPVYYWALMAQGYATGTEEGTGAADLLPLCAQLWSHPLFPSIFALLFHLWLLGQFSTVGSQAGFQSVQLAALASGCQRLFWSDVQTHSAEFRSIFGFICSAVTDRERMQSVAPQLHRELAFVAMRFAFYYTSGEPAVSLVKQLPARGVLASKEEALQAGIPWEFVQAAPEQHGGLDLFAPPPDSPAAAAHHSTQASAPALLQQGGPDPSASGILRSGRFPKPAAAPPSSQLHAPPPQGHEHSHSVPGGLLFAPDSPGGMRHAPSLSSLTAEQAGMGVHTPPRRASAAEGGSPGGHSASTPYMFDSDSDGSPPITPRLRNKHSPDRNMAAVDVGVMLAGHPPLPDFTQPLGGGFSPPLTAPAASGATAGSPVSLPNALSQSVPGDLPSATAAAAEAVSPDAAGTPSSAARTPFARNPAAQSVASEVRRAVAEQPELQFNTDTAGDSAPPHGNATAAATVTAPPSMAGVSQGVLLAAAAADAAAVSRADSEATPGRNTEHGSLVAGEEEHGIDSDSDGSSVAAEAEASAATVLWGQPAWSVPPADPRAMAVKAAALVLQASTTVRGIRHEASLVHYLASMASFADGGVLQALTPPSAARLRTCLHAFTSPGGPLFPTKRVRAVSRRTLDTIFPTGVTVRRAVSLAFRLLSPSYVLESAQHTAWATTLSCAQRLGCSPRQVTLSAVGLLNSLSLSLPAPVTASLQSLPRGGDAAEGGVLPVHATVQKIALHAQACCSRVLCVCCCVPTRFTMPDRTKAVGAEGGGSNLYTATPSASPAHT